MRSVGFHGRMTKDEVAQRDGVIATLDDKKREKYGLALQCRQRDGGVLWWLDAGSSNALTLSAKEVVTALGLPPFRALPIRALSLNNRPFKAEALAPIFASKAGPDLRALDLTNSPALASAIPQLVTAQLEELYAGRCELTSASLAPLFASEAMRHLAILQIDDNPKLDGEAWSVLARSPHVARLRVLHAARALSTDADLEAMCAGAAFAHVEQLAFGADKITTARGVRAIAACAHLAGCRYLGLPFKLDADGARALAAGVLRPRELELGPFGGEEADFATLFGGAWFAELERLELSTRVGESVLRALGHHPTARPKTLDLRPFDTAAVVALLGPALADIVDLQLRNLDDDGAVALAASPLLRGLRRLNLEQTQISDVGARALAASPHLGALERLHLYNTQLTLEGASALVDSPSLGALRHLDLFSMPKLSSIDAQALAKRARPTLKVRTS